MEILSTEQLIGPFNDIEAKFAPAHLYFSGDTALLRQSPRVAVVGSREASKKALERTARLVVRLVQAQAIIISGLAKGIDTAAHQTAIDSNGHTIAVLGTPLDIATPKSNQALQDLIKRDHLAVSQFAPGSVIQKRFFPMRNRTMALICQASVIVEASDGSGTLSQGWEALRLGRPLFIAEEIVDNKSLTWPAEMLDYGARILGQDADDLLEILPPPGNLDIIQHAF
jgi:DNA processing protein